MCWGQVVGRGVPGWHKVDPSEWRKASSSSGTPSLLHSLLFWRGRTQRLLPPLIYVLEHE